MSEYQVYFSAVYAPQWKRIDWRGDPVKISGNPRTISSNDTLTLYSTDANRLWKGMKTLGGSVELADDTVIRYEYWVSWDNPYKTWSLNNASGMKYAGLKRWLEANHRIVFCKAGVSRNRRSVVILRPVNVIEGDYPLVLRIANLVDRIKKHAKAEKGEGTGEAIDVAVTDGVVPFLSALIG
jgi:hypothetical protein